MTKIYYTAHEGRRNAYGHTRTSGTAYTVKNGELVNIGEYSHQSGGAGIDNSILPLAEKHGIDTNGGYYGNYHEAIELIQL